MALTNRICDLAPPLRRAVEQARPKVCLVNDDDAVLISLKFLFRASGFEVRAFANGRGLLASPALRRADCFVLDHKPRGFDGLDLARKIRSLGLSAPVVLTTGFRCGALESLVGAADRVIAAPRVDEELIERLVCGIEERRAHLRRVT
jgi:FixJ family two-component response regulator